MRSSRSRTIEQQRLWKRKARLRLLRYRLRGYRPIVLAVAFVLSVYLLSTFVLPIWFTHSLVMERDLGKRSDNINALFSGLALAGIVMAILLQSKELRLQRVELEQTREQLKKSAEAQEKSERALAKQADALLIAAKLNAANSIVSARKAERDLTPTAGGGQGSASTVKSIGRDRLYMEILLADISAGENFRDSFIQGHPSDDFFGKTFLESFGRRLHREFEDFMNSEYFGCTHINSWARDISAELDLMVNFGPFADFALRQQLESYKARFDAVAMPFKVEIHDDEEFKHKRSEMANVVYNFLFR